jgi:hypothetical protein
MSVGIHGQGDGVGWRAYSWTEAGPRERAARLTEKVKIGNINLTRRRPNFLRSEGSKTLRCMPTAPARLMSRASMFAYTETRNASRKRLDIWETAAFSGVAGRQAPTRICSHIHSHQKATKRQTPAGGGSIRVGTRRHPPIPAQISISAVLLQHARGARSSAGNWGRHAWCTLPIRRPCWPIVRSVPPCGMPCAC